jgi:hypothetical protein
MNKLRNPFRMRASEKIESNANFLRIYSPLSLDVLLQPHKESRLWEYVTYIHSSPGGGKTSLLRIFEPSVLNTIFNSNSSYIEIFQKLKNLDVISEQVNVLGIYLLCSRTFQLLEDINLQPMHRNRLFFSLLNSRLILTTLKNILVLRGKRFPEGLNDISFNYQDIQNNFKGLKFPCTGKDLYNWAATYEENIFTALDSLIPIKETVIPGHSGLFAFSAMHPKNFTIDGGNPICEKFLFMLDDAHKLSPKQRDSIKSGLIENRGLFTLFIAERVEALEVASNIDHINIKERDFQSINLENFLRTGKKLESLLSSVGEKRAELSSDNVSTFKGNLSDVLNEEKYKNQYIRSSNDSLAFFLKVNSSVSRFKEWFEYAKSLQSKYSYKEYAIYLKQIEIIVYRNLRTPQFDFSLSLEELMVKIDSVKKPAEYFICRDYSIPYYYDFNNIVKISSYNIEQFLAFSSHLFERILSNNLLGNITLLTPEEQEGIILDIVKKRWEDMHNGIPYSAIVVNFLKKTGEFCYQESKQPNAPYNAGVNGFGISDYVWYNNGKYESLTNVISTCVAFNLLEVRPTPQGAKGQLWNVYYLNRWLCVYFNLPLDYGNWRPKKPVELMKWLK